MKKLRFFGLLVTIALLAFGLTVGCSNGSTEDEPEAQSSVFTGRTANGQDVEITFSNVAFAKARAAGPYQNGFYLLKIDGVEKSRGRTRLDSNKDITFIPDGGGAEFHGELLNGVLEVSGTVDGAALVVRTTTEDSGTTPGGVGGGTGGGTGGPTKTEPILKIDSVNRTSDTEGTITFTTKMAGYAMYAVVEPGVEPDDYITLDVDDPQTNDVTVGENTRPIVLTAGAKDVWIYIQDAWDWHDATKYSNKPKIRVEAYDPDALTTINIAAITGVTAPVAGATPVPEITETAQYTGTVAWNPAIAEGDGFACEETYTATITLTAKAGFKLDGVAADSFTVTGATTVNNAVNTGVVTAEFPATTHDWGAWTVVTAATATTLGEILGTCIIDQATMDDPVSYVTDAYTDLSITAGVVSKGNPLTITALEIPVMYETATDTYEAVTAIAANGFASHTTLATITIPEGITSIGNGAFSSCVALTAITVAAANPNYSSDAGVLYNKNKTELLQYPRAKTGAFTIPNTVTSIGASMFSGTGLTSITIPDSVTSIGDDAFDNCTSLTTVTFSGTSTITAIPDFAFINCTSLDTITIPASVTSIGDMAFRLCTDLTTINIPANVTSIGLSAFDGSGLTSITIPASVTSIGDEVFSGCEDLDTVTFTGTSAITAIPMKAFASTALTDITIPDSVETIGKWAFGDCGDLTTVTIGTTSATAIESIGEEAFVDCDALTTVTIYAATPPSLGTGAFDGCTALTDIKVPTANVAAYQADTDWNALGTISALP